MSTEQFYQSGHLFPIAKGEKRPLNKNWRTREYSRNEIADYRAKGYPIGWSPDSKSIVIDIDPRNGGDESFVKLCRDTQVNLEEIGTVVDTPTGGRHIYFSKPDALERVRKNIPEYAGIDFITTGTYVLTAGSKHPNGGTYNERDTSRVSTLPENVCDVVRKVIKDNANTVGEYDHNNLAAVLLCIDVDAFHGSRDDWFQLMASSHYATGGCPEAREVFLDWCVQDSSYSHQREDMAMQWDNLQTSGYTTGTLVNILAQHTDREYANELFRHFRGEDIEFEVSDDDFEEVDIPVTNGSDNVEIETDDGQNPFGILSLKEVMAKKIKVEYLIDNFLSKYQPMVIGGPSKVLKTSITIDIVLSLASGTECLDKFKVNGQHSVLFLSAESGLGTLQEKFAAVIDKRGIEEDALDRIYLGDQVPRLDSLEDIRTRQGGKLKITEADGIKLKKFIMKNEIDVVIIDPLYLALPSEESSNLQAQGRLLLQFVNLMLEAQATPILLHHTKKTVKENQPLNLNALTGAGIAEFTRQWVLLSRRSEYSGNGRHDLHFVWGGSAGHNGYELFDADEGTMSIESNDDDDFEAVEGFGDPTLAAYTEKATDGETNGVHGNWRRWDIRWTKPNQNVSERKTGEQF